MTLLSHRKNFLLNWLKAFMLSPGMLFPAGYLLLYLTTNIYLNADFKKNLTRSVRRVSGNTWNVSITSLKSGLVLDSVTLHHIELTKANMSESRAQVASPTIIINTLYIPYPNLQRLLFSSDERISSTSALCEKILAEKRPAQ